MIIITLTGCKNKGTIFDTKNYDTLDDFVGEYVSYDEKGNIQNNGEVVLKIIKNNEGYFVEYPKRLVIGSLDTLKNEKHKIGEFVSITKPDKNGATESILDIGGAWSLYKVSKGKTIDGTVVPTNFYFLANYTLYPKGNLEKVK